MTRAPSPPASLCRWWRLYAAGLVATLPLLFVFVIQQRMPGFLLGPGDFAMFYTGATLAREHPAALYDIQAQTETQQAILAPFGWTYADGLLPYNYPPFVAVALQWLTLFPLQTAYFIWLGLNIASLFLVVVLTPRPWRGFLAWLLLTWPITWMVLLQGQPGTWLVLFLAAGWWFWQRRRPFAAGLAWAGLALKPQFAFLVWFSLLWRRERRAWAGLATGLAGLFVLTALTVGWRSWLAWGRFLLFTARTTNAYGIDPTKMPNLRGFASMFNLPPMWVWAIWGLAGVALVFWLVRLWRRMPNESLAFVAAVVGTLLLTPHSFLHDMLLLAAIAPVLWQNALPSQARAATVLLLATHLLAFVNVFTIAPPAVSGMWLLVSLAWWGLVFRLAAQSPRSV